MFPFDEKPISKLRTSSDIERFGQQALLRALNIGRVVAFVGSGSSLKFGQPTWDETAQRAANLFFELENAILSLPAWKKGSAFKTEFRESLSPLVNEIKELRDYQGIQASHFVELVEDYFSIVCDLLYRHRLLQDDEDPTEYLKKSEDNRLFARSVLATKPDHLEDQTAWETHHTGTDLQTEDGINRLVRSVEEFRHEFANQFISVHPTENTLKSEKSFSQLLEQFDLNTSNIVTDLDTQKADLSNIDAARTLRRRLGVRRFLTLNYDLELEIMLFEEGRATPQEEFKDFESFVLQNRTFDKTGKDRERGRAVTLQSPSGRVIRSSSSRKETLADLFAFGAFPTNYDAAVHHLHGRVDDPNNMIITPKDYQRVYYGASDQKKSFDEARHAVFTGSDIFVLGLGTSEHDVLKPLRDFLELEADRRDAYGKVYYVTTSEFSGREKDLLRAFYSAQRSAMAKTQSLYKDYGMHTLYIDQSFDKGRSSIWTSDSASIFTARAEIANYIHQIREKSAGINIWQESEVQTHFDRVFKNIRTYGADPAGTKGTSTGDVLLLKQRQEVKLARELITVWRDQSASTTKSENISAHTNPIIAALKGLDNHLRNCGLVLYCKRLEQERRSWWTDWAEFPGLRVAMLGPHRYTLTPKKDPQAKKDTKIPDEATEDSREATEDPEDAKEDPKLHLKETSITYPVIWRQTNLVSSFSEVPIFLGDPEDTPQFTGLIIATAKARRSARNRIAKQNQSASNGCNNYQCFPTEHPATVARISIPPGGGKGRLLSFFTTPQKLSDDSAIKHLPFQALFNDKLEKAKSTTNEKLFSDDPRYKACYVVHLTFALEFSSSMIAFARLLQQLLPDLRKEIKNTPGHDNRLWEKLQEHQFQKRSGIDPCIKTLRDMFSLLEETCPPGGWKTRMIAFFSYLDRLVDSHGDPFSPVHRAFFRLISGWNDEYAHMRLPIDTILINCNADQPIRYLSHERQIRPKKEDRRDSKWQSARWAIRHDREIALEYWTELPRVRPRIIFKEALQHAAAIEHARPEVSDQATLIFELLDGRDDPSFDNDFLDLPPNLKKFMYRRVANGHLLAGLANAIYVATKNNESPFTDFETEWQRSISSLDIAYTREKTRGVIDELLSIYRLLDRHVTTNTPQESRTSRLNISRSNSKKERFRTMLVDHLALLNLPLTAYTLASCPDVRIVAGSQPLQVIADNLTKELNLLVARGMAARYYKYADRIALPLDVGSFTSHDPEHPSDYVYALDSKVASVLRARADLEVFSQYKLVAFQTNVYPSQPERALKPTLEHFDRVSGIVRALVKTSHDELVQRYWDIRNDKRNIWPKDYSVFAAEMDAYNDKLRAAYSLVRGTFSISVIARLAENEQKDGHTKPFDEYRTWIRKLLNTATLLSKIRGLFMQRYSKVLTDPLPYNHTFLRDEVSWLYNERALVSFVQGRLFDALPLFEQARIMLGSSIKRSAPQSEEATHRRVQMNFALAQVERGNIVLAQDILLRIIAETDEKWHSDTPSVINCMAKGYMALCHHLTNEFTRAQAGYKEVIETMGQFDHPRAESIFRRHYADLLRAMAKSRNDQEYKDAIALLRSSEELALGIRATDLHHYALIAQARLYRDMENRSSALENLRKVERYATTMGVQKMLCEVLKVRGEVLLAEGETTQAGFVTSQSIAISKRNGMRLRKISAAIVQSKILHERNQKVDARRLLHETILESQVLGYATKTSQAFDLLS